MSRMKALTLLPILMAVQSIVCEDYDFSNVEDVVVNETVMIWKEEGQVNMTWSEAIEMMKLDEVSKYREIIQEKKNEVDELKREKQTLAGEVNNKDILIRFLSTLLQNNEKQSKVSREMIKAQNEKLKILGEERKTYQEKNKVNLRQAYLQAEVILTQERQKEDLKEALKIDTNLRQEYCNLTQLSSANTVDNYPAYVQMMTKALTDQTEDLKKLRSFLDHENKLEPYMREILEEMKKLNVTFTSDTAEWDLNGSLMSMVEVQAESLESLKPTISYAVNNNRGFNYHEIDGKLVAISTCQCIPQTEDSSIIVSGIEFTCPAEMAVHDTGKETGISSCLNGVCEEKISKTSCVDKWSTWSEWMPYTDSYCFVVETRTRGRPGNEDVQTRGVKSHFFVVKSSTNLTVVMPDNKTLALFGVGGGGAADSSIAGSSGFFAYEAKVPCSRTVELELIIGAGGASGGSGTPTTVTLDGRQVLSASGGGGGNTGLSGWSGVTSATANSQGGSNGQYGSGESLPTLCGGVSLAPGAAGVSSGDGSGGGGVVVNGEKPVKLNTMDGEGFGAGGGEDDLPGYEGVIVIMLCGP